MEELKKIFIECECGTHVLLVQSDVEYFNNNTQVRQEFDLAMFNYAYTKRRNFFERIPIIWNYLRTGKMHEDQLCLASDEAKKLADFINDNIVATEK